MPEGNGSELVRERFSSAVLSSPEMRSRDTSGQAAAVQSRLQDSLTPEQRLQLALKYSDFAREFARATIRQRYPRLTEAEISRELIEQLHRSK